MAKFRKKPVVIEAEQYVEYGKLVKGMCNSRSCFTLGGKEPHVHTIHNNQIVNLEVGDWIVPEPDGEHYYPIKPEILADTYDEVFTFKFDRPVYELGKKSQCECKKADRDTGHHEIDAFKEKIANAVFSRKPLYEKIDIAREILEELDAMTH